MTEKRSASRSVGPRPPLPPEVGLVLLDTNALFLPFRDRFPLEDEVERLTAPARVAVPSSVIAELDRLVAQRAAGAALAREFARRFPIVPTQGRGDQGLLQLAARRRAIVVTGDRALRRRLVAAGIAVLAPRGSVRLARSEPDARPALTLAGRHATALARGISREPRSSR